MSKPTDPPTLESVSAELEAAKIAIAKAKETEKALIAKIDKLEAAPPPAPAEDYALKVVTDSEGKPQVNGLKVGGTEGDELFVFHREITFSGDSGYDTPNLRDRAMAAAKSAFPNEDGVSGAYAVKPGASNLPKFSEANRLVVILKVIRAPGASEPSEAPPSE